MSWKSVAMVVTGVFTLGIISAFLGPIVVEIVTAMMATGDYDGQYVNEGMAMSLIGTWFDTIILAMFGLLIVAAAWVLRKELTRGGM